MHFSAIIKLQIIWEKNHHTLLCILLLFLDYYCLRTVPTNKKSIFMWFMTMRGRQISSRAIEIQKRNLGITTHFSEIIKRQLF